MYMYIYICTYMLVLYVYIYIYYIYMFILCVYSFLICWSPLCVILFSLGRLWASFWEPLGCLGPPRGCPWRHFGFPLAPCGRRGTIWGTFGSQVELGLTLGQKGTSNSEQMSLKYATCAQKMTSQNSMPRAPYPHKVSQEPQLPTPLHSRRGLG